MLVSYQVSGAAVLDHDADLIHILQKISFFGRNHETDHIHSILPKGDIPSFPADLQILSNMLQLWA
jgi:hypothetical protein